VLVSAAMVLVWSLAVMKPVVQVAPAEQTKAE
jgi:hypothetical protein